MISNFSGIFPLFYFLHAKSPRESGLFSRGFWSEEMPSDRHWIRLPAAEESGTWSKAGGLCVPVFSP
jgi:hypothetical protein